MRVKGKIEENMKENIRVKGNMERNMELEGKFHGIVPEFDFHSKLMSIQY